MEIIFDFDGTIADTFDVGIEVINRLTGLYDSPEMGPKEIKIFRDLGVREAMRAMKKNGMSWVKLLKVGRRIQKELNKEMGRIKVFTGVEKVIRKLKVDGYILGILSTNTKKNINDFLRMNRLDKMFDYVEKSGIILGKTRRLKRIMKRRGLDPGDVIYIGDEVKDIVSCKKLGIKIIVVTWGWNAEKRLMGYKPDWIVKKPEDILYAIRGSKKR
jgi:HAD superfamily hydrolase (TIGR01549 family)